MVIIRKHFDKEFLYPIEDQNKQNELPKYFEGKGEVKGFTFLQVRCLNKVCIYHVSDTFGNEWYEVFTMKFNRLYNAFYYPKSNAFGISAWTCKTIEKAEQKFNSLLSEVEMVKPLNNKLI